MQKITATIFTIATLAMLHSCSLFQSISKPSGKSNDEAMIDTIWIRYTEPSTIATDMRYEVDIDTTINYNYAFEIPESMKGYVATAYAMKYISGSLSNGELCFQPNEAITRAQAAVILCNIVGFEDVAVTPTFADGSEIPTWASESIYSLNAAGIMVSHDGYISATSKLTREQTAEMLAAVMQYVE